MRFTPTNRDKTIGEGNNDSARSTTTTKPKSSRNPKCTRCQNHGKKVDVKFHKRECEHRYCLCELCILTAKRQTIMKEQTAKRRARQQYEILMQMRKEKAIKEEPKTPSAVNNNDSNSNNSNSNSVPSLSSSTSEPNKDIVKPVVKLPLPQNLPPLLPYPTSPSMLFEPESITDPKQIEDLVRYSESMIELFRYPDPLSLMYVILKDCKSDVEVAIRRISKANSELQALAQYKALKFGSLGIFGNQWYFGQVPYAGITSPPSTAGLSIFPYSLGSHVMTAKVPLSPDTPPEWPPSNPDTVSTGIDQERNFVDDVDSVTSSLERSICTNNIHERSGSNEKRT